MDPIAPVTPETPGDRSRDVASEGEDNTRARQAIHELEHRLALRTNKSEAQLNAEVADGSLQTKVSWIRDGLLVGSEDLGLAWSCSEQDLEDERHRGELFGLEISERRWYPAAFLTIPREAVRAVNLALKGLDPISSFIFWHGKHGSLQGQTLHAALRSGQKQAVLRLAEVFASQHVA